MREAEMSSEAKGVYRQLASQYPNDPYGEKANQFLQAYYKDYSGGQ